MATSKPLPTVPVATTAAAVDQVVLNQGGDVKQIALSELPVSNATSLAISDVTTEVPFLIDASVANGNFLTAGDPYTRLSGQVPVSALPTPANVAGQTFPSQDAVNAFLVSLIQSGGVASPTAPAIVTHPFFTFGPSHTVTITNASPGVVTWTAHGKSAGDWVQFTTTGTLPAPLVAGQVYYLIASGLSTNVFEVSATSGGSAINTTSAGSGTHTGWSSAAAGVTPIYHAGTYSPSSVTSRNLQISITGSTGTTTQQVTGAIDGATMPAIPASAGTGRAYSAVELGNWGGPAPVSNPSVVYAINAIASPLPTVATPPTWGNGTPVPGATFAVTPATFNNTPLTVLTTEIRQDWISEPSNIGTLISTTTATTGITAVLTSAEAGHALYIRCLATNSAGAGLNASVSTPLIVTAVTGVPQWGALDNSVPPEFIAGTGALLPTFSVNTAAVGDTVSINPGTAVPSLASLDFQWRRAGNTAGMPAGNSATASLNYQYQSQDSGALIDAVVVPRNSGGTGTPYTIPGVLVTGVAAAPPAMLRTDVGAFVTTFAGTALDLTSYSQTLNETFSASDVGNQGSGKFWTAAQFPSFGDTTYQSAGGSPDTYPFATSDQEILVQKQGGIWWGGIFQSVDNTGLGFSQALGYFEATMQLDGHSNTWPAFWLLDIFNISNPTLPHAEIDIVEQFGPNNTQYFGTAHIYDPAGPTDQNVPTTVNVTPNMSTGFHQYGVNITPQWVILYFDRVEIGRWPAYQASQRPMYMLLDHTLNTLPSDSTTRVLQIQSVKVYSQTGGTPGGGSLSMALTADTNTSVNVTTGATDWTVWLTDYNTVDTKSGGGTISMTMAAVNDAMGYPVERTMTWTGGTPTSSGSNAAGAGLFIPATGVGAGLPAPETITFTGIGTSTSTCRVFGRSDGVQTVNIVANISDSSAPNATYSGVPPAGPWLLTISVAALSVGQTLTVTQTLESDPNNNQLITQAANRS